MLRCRLHMMYHPRSRSSVLIGWAIKGKGNCARRIFKDPKQTEIPAEWRLHPGTPIIPNMGKAVVDDDGRAAMDHDIMQLCQWHYGFLSFASDGPDYDSIPTRQEVSDCPLYPTAPPWVLGSSFCTLFLWSDLFRIWRYERESHPVTLTQVTNH